MKDLSNIFKNAVINLYKNSVYTVDYAIIEASKLADKNKINAKDYQELMTYLAEEQEKSMQEDMVTTEEVVILMLAILQMTILLNCVFVILLTIIILL